MPSRKLLPIFIAASLATPAGATPKAWIAAVQARVRAEQTYPRSAQLRGATCTAKVEIRTDGNGLITGYDIVQPCELAILNRQIDSVMMRVGQFAPPPDSKPQRFELTLSWGRPNR